MQRVQSCLERITDLESTVKAWTWLDPEQALAAARDADAQDTRGPLHGMPIGIKDVIDTADMPTAYGSPIYNGHRPSRDAACVATLRSAGAVILGKTVTTEFACNHPGKTSNPHDPGRTPGGSSSGSAAAVACGMVPAALGTQTAGSVIRPAAYCGVVGYKPSYGFINRAGVKLIAESLDTIGVIARTVDDAAVVASVLAARGDLSRLERLTAPPLLMVVHGPHWHEADDTGRAALIGARERLATAGATIVDAELPPNYAELAAAHGIIMFAEACRAFAHELRTAPALISDRLRERLSVGAAYSPREYEAAQDLAERCRIEAPALFADCDAILTLSAPGEAPRGLGSTGNPIFNGDWTLLHLPCVNVPGMIAPSGMPVGIQLVGKARGDAALLAVARWVHGVLALG